MRHLLTILVAIITLTKGVYASGPEQPQVSFTPGASNTWNMDWNGIVGRTYFIQWSLDLIDWNFAPTMDFGDNPEPYGIGTDGTSKFFVRLIYADENWVGTLQEAREADFDSDGISNVFEVEEIGSDPFDSDSVGIDTDNDGMPDWWENLYDLDPYDPSDANGDLVADGVTNLVKYQTGRNPLVVALTDSAGILALKVHTPLE